MFVLENVAADFYILKVRIVLLLLLLSLLQPFLLLLDELFVISVGADEGHKTLVESIGLYFLATKRAFIKFELQVLLDQSLGRVLKEAILANIVATGKKNHGLSVGRDHQIQANTANVGLNFVSNLFVELLCILFVIFVGGIAHLLDEVDCIILHAVLHIHFLADLLFFSLLIPYFPFLLVQSSLLVFHRSSIYYNHIQMRVLGRSNTLAYRSISQMDEQQAQQLTLKLNLAPQTRKPKTKEENYIVRNGLLKKLQANQINFTTQQTKIITDYNSPWEEERIARNSGDQRHRDIQNQQKNNTNFGLKKSNSFVEDFLTEQNNEADRIKQDYCRVWYQKMALQAHVVYLEQQNQRKDELISQMRQEIESKSHSQTHFNVNQTPLSQSTNHNKSLSHHPGFSVQGQPSVGVSNANHWGSMHPSRNFNQTTTSVRNF